MLPTNEIVTLIQFMGVVHTSDIALAFPEWGHLFTAPNALHGHQISSDLTSGTMVAHNRAVPEGELPAIAIDFIEKLANSELIRRAYAVRIASTPNWEGKFSQPDSVVKVLYALERYADVVNVVENHHDRDFRIRSRSLWFESLARTGRFAVANFLESDRASEDVAAFLRYCWQKGNFDVANDVIAKVDEKTLPLIDRVKFLNTKVRVLRDTGSFADANHFLEQMGVLVASLKEREGHTPDAERAEGTFIYNCAIQSFVQGKLSDCIQLCRVSLDKREDRYSKPYLLSRIARCEVLLGNKEGAVRSLNEARAVDRDPWAESLLITVSAEIAQYLDGDLVRAEGLWRDAIRAEELSLPLICYSKIGLLYNALSQSRIDVARKVSTEIAGYVVAEAKVARVFARWAVELQSRNVRVAVITEAISEFGDYPTWAFNGLFAICHKLGSDQLSHLANSLSPFDLDQNQLFAARDKRRSQMASANDPPKIFVVHGHDEGAKQTVARFLEKIGLSPIILHEQSSRNRTVIEKLEENAEVAFAVVLLTGDDVGAMATQRKSLKLRARQNVILELGYFLGLLGRDHVCALKKGEVEVPSDYHGVIFTPLDEAGAWKMQLARELEAADIRVDFAKVAQA